MDMDAQRERILALYEQLERAADPADVASLASQLLALVRREDAPLVWANLQGAYGAGLAESTRGKWTEERVAQVVGAYEAALTVYTPEANPAAWGQTQRNIGATHLAAVNSDSGLRTADSRPGGPSAVRCPPSAVHFHHIQSAIAAYELALRIPAELHHPGIAAAAEAELAAAYAELLGGIDRERDPELWASLHLDVAFHLSNSGAADVGEDVIEACDAALTVLDRERHAEQWAEAHLLRGSQYRVRKTGERDENLEQAVASLGHALEVFTSDSNPGGWRTAHYNRGPAYLHRKRGERAQNLDRARESLQISVKEASDWLAPAACAALAVSLGQIYLETGAIEEAIETLEPALPMLAPDPSSLSWHLAQRFLAHAYVLRTGGDRQANRAAAISHFSAALERPAGAWDDPQTWAWAEAMLAQLELDENADMIGRRPDRSDSEEPAPPPMQPSTRDPFDMAGHARTVPAAISETPLDFDPGWHVPFLLNEEASLVRRHFQEFLQTGTLWMRTVEERIALERGRGKLIAMLAEHLTEKQAEAARVGSLLDRVARGEQPFVLMLRGFGMRAMPFARATVNYGGGAEFGETAERHRIARALAPLPVVWISNPVDSAPLEAAGHGETVGYRVESGVEWERDVRGLIAAASFIVMYNPVMTDGVRTEIGALKELGRLGDAFFSSPDAASDAAGVPCQPLTDTQLDIMRAKAGARPVDRSQLPAGTCPWVDGPSRHRIERELPILSAWAQRLTTQPSRITADLRLDAYAYQFAGAVLAERIELLPALLHEMADALRVFEADDLPEASARADRYVRLAGAFQAT